jgi:predicted Zn-dependent protease
MHDLLGQILAQEGKPSPAGKEFGIALDLDPAFGPAQLDLAETLVQQGQPRTAVVFLEKAAHSSLPEVAQRAHEMLQQLAP